MKQLKLRKNLITASFRSSACIRTWTLLLCSILLLHEPSGLVGVTPATGHMHYGIQGQQAPELNLTDWIDGDGNRIDPIHLSSHRGKVIYLYFFQDW